MPGNPFRDIQAKGIDAHRLTQSIQNGSTKVPGVLGSADIRALLTAPFLRYDRTWETIGETEEQGMIATGWQNSLTKSYANHISGRFHPATTNLLRSFRTSVRQAAIEAGIYDLAIFGETQIRSVDDKRYARFLGARFYRLLPGGEIYTHEDPELKLGVQLNIPLTGPREYESWVSGRPETYRRFHVEVGSGWLQAESPIDPLVKRGSRRPLHRALRNNTDQPVMILILDYSESELSDLHVQMLRGARRFLPKRKGGPDGLELAPTLAA